MDDQPKRNTGYTLLFLGFIALFAGNLLTFAFDLGRVADVVGVLLMMLAGGLFGASIVKMANARK